jgi:PAS domain S-box-containing protein
MARLTRNKVSELLRLKWERQLSHEEVARSLGISTGVVTKYLKVAMAAGLDRAQVRAMDAAAIERAILEQRVRSSGFAVPDFGRVHRQLAYEGNSLVQQWEQYRSAHPTQRTYGYTQFRERYRNLVMQLAPSMRRVEPAGDKLFVGFTSAPLFAADGSSARLFVAVMGASQLAFACTTTSDSLADLLRSIIQAMEFYRGAPRQIVPADASGPLAAPRQRPASGDDAINALARHYGTAIMPRRAYGAREDVRIEPAWRATARWISLCLSRRTFNSAAEIDVTVRELIALLNQRALRKLPGSRARAFASIDAPALVPLPAQRYAVPARLSEIPPPGATEEPKPAVLVAEGSPGLSKYLARLLRRHYRVIVARDGERARRSAVANRPEVLLLNATLTGADTPGLLRKLRADLATAGTAIIAIAADDRPVQTNDWATLADAYVSKPFSARALLAKVNAMVTLAQVRRQSRQREIELRELRPAGPDILEKALHNGAPARDAGHVTDQWRTSGRSATPPPPSGSTNEELRQSHERLALILNSIDDGFVAVDRNGRVTYLNMAARTMLAEQGIAPDELLGKHYVEEALPGLRNTEGGRGFYRAMGEREPVTVLNFYAPFERWYAIRFFPTTDGGVTIVFQDVTERKR